MNNDIDRYQVSLKLFLKNKEGKTLILKAAPGCSYSGFWDFPGGRIAYSEFATSLEEILKREVIEEVGDVDFTIDKRLPVSLGRHKVVTDTHRDVHVLYLFYEGVFHEGEVVISSEHTEYKWVDLSNIDIDMHFTSGLREAVLRYI